MDDNQYLLSLLSELYEVKCHLSNDRQFEGGFGLGQMYKSICNKTNSIQEEYDEYDEEECEKCHQLNLLLDEQRGISEATREISEERIDIIKNLELSCKHAFKQKKILVDLLKSLISRDHIYDTSLDETITILASVVSETEDEIRSIRINGT